MMRTNTTGGQRDRPEQQAGPHGTYSAIVGHGPGGVGGYFVGVRCVCGLQIDNGHPMNEDELYALHHAHANEGGMVIPLGAPPLTVTQMPSGPVEPTGGMHGLDGKPAARCYTCDWTHPADTRGDALLLISRHLNEVHDGGRIDVREPGTLLSGGYIPRVDRRITPSLVHESLRGNFDGLPAADAELMLSVLSALYPQGASLSAYEATEALLRAGFSRGHR